MIGLSTTATSYISGIKGGYQSPTLRYTGGIWGNKIIRVTAAWDITKDRENHGERR
jgi:hypothetical protein